jgi:uncharacterized phage protein (TIGR01671 family)
MMRNIEFRGISQEKKDWVYGLPKIIKNTTGKIIACYIQYFTESYHLVEEEIFIETLGEFVLKNKNGVKIFEGDIVNVSKNFPEQYEVIYQDISFRFKATKNNHFVREGSIWSLDLDFEFEVIGNKWKNPELYAKEK